MTFGILGPLEVREGPRLVPLGAAKVRVLLACLLLRVGESVSPTELFEAVWSDELPAVPKAALHNLVRRLRRTVPGHVIDTTSTGYRLAARSDRIDLCRFRDLVGQARQRARAGDLPEEAAILRDALVLWRGPALADVSSDSLQRHEVPGLTEERLGSLERRIAVDLALGAHSGVIGELRGLTSRYPMRERLWSQLILALYRDERPSEALTTYHQARALIVEETGVDPGPELQRLYQAILDSDPKLDPPLSPPATILTGGKRRQPTPPSRLLTDITGLVGRQSMAARIAELLTPTSDPAAAPLVVLSGPPGVGKTALATFAAHRLRSWFPDGQLYAKSGRHSAPSDVLAGFLRVLGVSPRSTPPGLDERAALFRALLAGRRVLVVLDDADSPDQVRSMLPAEPGCAFLVTSRNDLQGLTAPQRVYRLRLDVLEQPAALDLLNAVVGAERVAREPEAAQELARLCGYLPLALRIAATNLAGRPHLAISDYVRELDLETG